MIRAARPALLAKANRRAAERQLFEMRPSGLEENATDIEPKMGDDDNTMLKGGGDAGLARVIGKGRKRQTKKDKEDEKLAAEIMHLKGKGSHKGKGKLKIEHGDDSESDEETGGARLSGKMLREHLEKLHGGRYAQRFLKGAGLVGAEFGRPTGREVAHAQMVAPVAGRARGGENLVPGAISPVAMGNAPQAPKSFARNSIGMSRAGEMMTGRGAVEATAALSKRQARGKRIAEIMRSKGVSLAEASKMLKQMMSE